VTKNVISLACCACAGAAMPATIKPTEAKIIDRIIIGYLPVSARAGPDTVKTIGGPESSRPADFL
jgi:hypothetical protein